MRMGDLPSETIAAINYILSLEESSRPDWEEVRLICGQELSRLNETGSWEQVDDTPYHFLEDCDIRQKDYAYGEIQRKKMRDFLEANRQ